ncbi:MAG: hypothetical protein SFY92_09255 [Verrucomicrobiae bacterium]|nr:hypothetical protein [Verrucomicrobiae bacterium]
MNIKTIALEPKVYERLAALKEHSETFSKLVERLMRGAPQPHNGSTISDRLKEIPLQPLSVVEAEQMLKKIQ